MVYLWKWTVGDEISLPEIKLFLYVSSQKWRKRYPGRQKKYAEKYIICVNSWVPIVKQVQIGTAQTKEGRGLPGSEENRDSAWDLASSGNLPSEPTLQLLFPSRGFPSAFRHLILVMISQPVFPETFPVL